MKFSLADIKESTLTLISQLKNKNESACSLLARSFGEEGVAKMLFEASAHIKVLARVEWAFNGNNDDDSKLTVIKKVLSQQSCNIGGEFSLFGQAFSSEQRLFASKLLSLWFE